MVQALAQADQLAAPPPGAIGCAAISVTSATFSSAVRLGIRL